jgi:hypothetical protein
MIAQATGPFAKQYVAINKKGEYGITHKNKTNYHYLQETRDDSYHKINPITQISDKIMPTPSMITPEPQGHKKSHLSSIPNG